MRRAQVEERKQPAREVHDTVAQKLTGLALRLEAADALLSNERERARARFRQAVDLTHATLDDVRRSVLDLRAAPLEGLSLGEALRSLINAFGREQHISARFESLGPTMPPSPRIEVGAFRTV
jgi:two-component system, NarL family, sensor kinase